MVEKAASLPWGRTQGWTSTESQREGSTAFFFTRSTNLFMLQLPAEQRSAANSWLLSRVAIGVQEEAVARGDLDDDGDEDLVVVDGDGKHILWLERDIEGGWRRHRIAAGLRWFDRLALADVNRDGRMDVIFTEETRDLDYDARVGWLEAPQSPRDGKWRSHTIVTLRSANSLVVRDFDGDGDQDVLVAEHTDLWPDHVEADNFTGIFMNQGAEEWIMKVIDIGPQSSHLGGMVADLDGDGVPEVLSIGYEQSCCIHRWSRRVPDPNTDRVERKE